MRQLAAWLLSEVVLKHGSGPNEGVVIGLDVEWRPQFKKGQAQNKIAVLQLATADAVCVFRAAILGARCMQCFRSTKRIATTQP